MVCRVAVPVFRVLGRCVPGTRGAVEADELHLGVAEVAVGHADGRDPAAPGAGVHGGRQICGRGGRFARRAQWVGSGRLSRRQESLRQWSEESEQGLLLEADQRWR